MLQQYALCSSNKSKPIGEVYKLSKTKSIKAVQYHYIFGLFRSVSPITVGIRLRGEQNKNNFKQIEV